MDLSLQSRNLNANFNVNSLQSVYKKKNDQNPDIQYNQQQVAPNRTKLINSYLPNDALRDSHQHDADNNVLSANKPVTSNAESAGLKKLENDAAVTPLSMSSLHSAGFFVSDGKKNSILQKPVLFPDETEINSGHNANEIQPSKNKFAKIIAEDTDYSNKLINQIQCDQSAKKFAVHQSHIMQQRPCLPQVEQKTSNSLMAACKQSSTYQYAQSALKSSLILNNQAVFDQAFHHLNTCNYLQCPKVDLADMHPLPYLPQHFQQQRNSFEEDDATQMQRNFLQQLNTDTVYKPNINHLTNELLIRKHVSSNAKRSSSAFNESPTSVVSQERCDDKQPIKNCIDQILINQATANQASLIAADTANYSKYTKTTEIAGKNPIDHSKNNSQLSITGIQESTATARDKNDYSSNENCQHVLINEISSAENNSSKLVNNEFAIDKSVNFRNRTKNANHFQHQNVPFNENVPDVKNEINIKNNNKSILLKQNDDNVNLEKATNELGEQKPIAFTADSQKNNSNLAGENVDGNGKSQVDSFSSNSNEENTPANSKENVHATTCESVNLTNSILKKTLETLNNTNVKISSVNDLSAEISLSTACTNKPCFEEVENKLEEMFAGIEDEPPMMCQVKNNSCLANKADEIHEGNFQIKNLNNTAEVINQNSNTSTRITPLTTKAMQKDTDMYSTLTGVAGQCISQDNPNKDLEKAYGNNNLDNDVDDIKSNSLTENANNKANQRKRSLRVNNKSKSQLQSRNSKVMTSNASAKGTMKTKIIKSNVHDDCKKKTSSWQNLPNHPENSTISNSQIEKMQRDMENKHRSPFIAIKSDGSVTITNTTNTEDVNDRYTKLKTCILGRKNVRGLHSSTLSSSYDADKTDSSWICVFCKCGPHKKGLGDLFGPYVASINCEEYISAINALINSIQKDNNPNKRKRYDACNDSDRNLSILPANKKNNCSSSNELVNSQRRKSCGNSRSSQKDCNTKEEAVTNYSNISDSIECLFGMRKISDESYEVWLHEDCAIWAQDIYLVGSEITGVGSAAWNSTQYHCSLCSNVGAMVCCLQRECKLLAHVPCAKAAQWLLDERTLWVYCQKHAKQQNLPSNEIASISPIT